MIVFEPGYTLPDGDAPLSHARIAHAETWVSGVASASSTAAGGHYGVDAPSNSTTYDRWRPNAVGWSWWSIVLDAPAQVDYCFIAAHDLGSTATRVLVQAFQDGAWVTIGSAEPTTDAPLFFIFEPRTVDTLRITFGAFFDVPEIGVIRFGRALQMPERATYGGHKPLDMSRATTLRGARSVRGAWLSTSMIRGALSGSFSWRDLPTAFARGELRTFLRATEGEAFAIAWRPDKHPEDVAYCWTPGGSPPIPVDQGVGDLMSLDLTVEAFSYE